MKIISLSFIIFVGFLFLISSCTKNQQSEDLEFKKMCQDAGYEWMLMKPTQDGKIIQEEKTCMGCMVEGIEHVCNMEKFNEMMKTGMGDGMDSMQQV